MERYTTVNMVYNEYKNISFGNERSGIIDFGFAEEVTEEHIVDYVFRHNHRFCGNHMEGHGEFEVKYWQVKDWQPPDTIKGGSFPSDQELLNDGWTKEQVKKRKNNNKK